LLLSFGYKLLPEYNRVMAKGHIEEGTMIAPADEGYGASQQVMMWQIHPASLDVLLDEQFVRSFMFTMSLNPICTIWDVIRPRASMTGLEVERVH
jgi:hypothetical protein